MNYELKEQSGLAFSQKKTNDKAPDFKGDFLLNGTKHTLSIWKRKTSKGDTMLGFAIQEAWGKPTQTIADVTIDNNDVPF